MYSHGQQRKWTNAQMNKDKPTYRGATFDTKPLLHKTSVTLNVQCT